ncbi:MAG TPA: cellulase family glycosylhydrolase [Chitinispirillaceae bacterium]|nr:cellulase family glycosylhydrolase [Chitinispirillaceae bacterium]
MKINFVNKIFLSAAVFFTFAFHNSTRAANKWEVDSKGNITLNGSVFRIKGGSWFGLEGRSELPSDEQNPNGAPMEMYMGNVFWNESNRTLASDAAEIKSLGFNSIRMPVAPQTLDDSDQQGRDPNLKNSESVRIQGAFTALKAVIKACADAGLYVLLDMHSCSNYVGWRAGRLDARPPYVDATREEYEFTREDCSCAANGNPGTVTRVQEYDVQKWLADLKKLAGLGAEIGVDNIMGIDIFNEPWDYSWSEWRSLIDQAYQAISSVNPNILIFAQGIGGTHGNQDGTPDSFEDTPHGDMATNPNWGENLFEAGDNPPSMPKNKLVFSPHCYGPAVCTQPMFADLDAQPECEGLVEDAFGDAKCQIVINPSKLEPGWDEHFGYLKKLGYAICIGEYGGNMDWPNKSEARHQNRYSYLTDKTTDKQWQEAFVNYLVKRGIYDSFYWSINPESADTYGIFKSPYDPISNKEGWGTWSGIDQRKMDLLSELWEAADKDPGAPVRYGENGNRKTGVNCRISNAGLITYSLPKAENVSLKLYNVNGRLQSEISSQMQKAGTYSINRKQISAAAGSYFLVLKAGDYSHKQMVCFTK